MQFAVVPAAETKRLAAAAWIATVDSDKIRLPVSKDAVPWANPIAYGSPTNNGPPGPAAPPPIPLAWLRAACHSQGPASGRQASTPICLPLRRTSFSHTRAPFRFVATVSASSPTPIRSRTLVRNGDVACRVAVHTRDG